MNILHFNRLNMLLYTLCTDLVYLRDSSFYNSEILESLNSSIFYIGSSILPSELSSVDDMIEYVLTNFSLDYD